jgi:hypothetical protein
MAAIYLRALERRLLGEILCVSPAAELSYELVAVLVVPRTHLGVVGVCVNAPSFEVIRLKVY